MGVVAIAGRSAGWATANIVAVVNQVRSGPTAGIFPMVFNDLVRWIDERGYRPAGPGRNVWLHEIDDIAAVAQQVFEIQLAFTRPEGPGEKSTSPD